MDDVKVASVNAGVVLLSGKAENIDQSLRAIENAYTVTGVHRVASARSPSTTRTSSVRRGTSRERGAFFSYGAGPLTIRSNHGSIDTGRLGSGR